MTKIYESKMVRKDIVTSITCNKCGRKFENTVEFNPDFNNCHSFEIGFWYGSEFDGRTESFDLCDDCMIEFIKSFKVPSLSTIHS